MRRNSAKKAKKKDYPPRVTLSLTPEEREMLKAMADRENQSITGMVRAWAYREGKELVA